MYEQKDIILIPFPYSDLTASKKRPALIILNKKLSKMEDVICCLVTTHPHKDDVSIEKDSFDNGKLPFKSWVKPHRIFTIDKRIIIKKICTINDSFYDKLIEKITSFIKRA